MRLWIKLYVELLDDPKVAAMPDPLFRTFVNLLVIAGRVDQNGRLGTAAEIAYWLRKTPAAVENHLRTLEECNVCVTKEGVTRLKNWQKFNKLAASNSRKAVRERVRKSRENKAKTGENAEHGNDDVTRYSPVSNAPREEKRREEKNKTSAGQNPPAPASAPEPDPVKELAAVFEQAAGVKLPEPSGEKAKKTVGVTWWHPLREMVKLANGNSEQLLRAAVKQLRAKNLNVSSPQSCLKTFVSLHGAAVTGAGASLAAQYRAAGYTDANGNPV